MTDLDIPAAILQIEGFLAARDDLPADTEVDDQHWSTADPLSLGALRTALAALRCTGASNCAALQHIEGCFAHPCTGFADCPGPQHVDGCLAASPLLPAGAREITQAEWDEARQRGDDRLEVTQWSGSILDDATCTRRYFALPTATPGGAP